MSKHNYSQYSNKKYENKTNATTDVTAENQNGVITDTVTEEVKTPVINTVETETTANTAEVTAETEAPVTETETNSGAVETGVVANCAKLNVRSKPSTDSDVVTVLNAGDEISIDVDLSTDEWLKIRTADGVKGYCMKKFVSANI